jgi:hypothetical protein
MLRKSISIGISCIILSTLLSGCTQQEPDKPQTITDIAIEYITLLSETNYQQAYGLFNKDMKNAISLEYLQEIWEYYIETYGEFDSITSTSQTNMSGFDVILVNATFQNNYLIVFRVVFNEEKQIAGFWMDDIISQIEYRPPDYVNTSQFSEVNITIGTHPWQLPATLTRPKGSGPFPTVILIHGSGPNDRDETIVPNKPFKDLAWGLASHNISVLRYEKRTKVYADEISTLNNFTVEDEIIDDVFHAITTLKNQSYVPVDSIYLLGHSLGGMMIPKILSINDTDISGAILLAAPARPLEDLIYHQTRYLLSIDGGINETEQATLDDINESAQKIKSLNFTDNETILSAPASYWKYLDSYDQVDSAKALDLPLFILQGKRDYQVTFEDDYRIWNESFAEAAEVTLQSYNSLNHLFISGQGTPTNNEYLIEGHVDAQVIEDIAQWIQTSS